MVVGGAVLGVTTVPAGAAPAAAVASAAAPTVSGADDRLLGLQLLEVVQPPTLSGTPGVGSLLTLTSPAWSLLGVTEQFAWLRNGVPIPGATGSTYVPTTADAGAVLQGVVTGSVLGLLPVEAVTGALQLPGLPGDGTGGTGGGTDGGGGTGGTDGCTTDPSGQLSVLQPPQIAGLQGVGSLLVVLDPLWSLPGISMAYQWFSGGVPVPGATDEFFVPGVAEAGLPLLVRVTGTLAGVPVVSTVSDTVLVPLLPDQELSASDAPTLTQPAKVGKPVVATDPTWSTDGVTATYQWFANGSPISGATAKSFTPTAAELAKTVLVKVTGTKEGWTAKTVDSTGIVVGKGDAPTFTAQPGVTGTHGLGSTLSATLGTWPGTTSVGAQWLRDGVPVAGASGLNYVVQAADVGRRLSVLVTAVKPGHETATFTTTPVAVAKTRASAGLRLVKAKVKKGTRAVAVLTLRAAGVRPVGSVTVLDGRRRLGTYRVDGTRSVKLPVLKPGRHALRAVYAGSATTEGARSRVLVLRVTKR
ncbi:Ig-like domain repeat protein [Nocardioides perillae]|uniref:Ig-like domain (Group 3) n=1 Tax=Nocardioides perillae TaxID=1119534 RepID=A0A7Y9RU16_9ACTN|nr:Ig-like domain repeat protein [Nocardioides perillae]NYG53975.1 hypothetical protein [Nocardioides perillae]